MRYDARLVRLHPRATHHQQCSLLRFLLQCCFLAEHQMTAASVSKVG